MRVIWDAQFQCECLLRWAVSDLAADYHAGVEQQWEAMGEYLAVVSDIAIAEIEAGRWEGEIWQTCERFTEEVHDGWMRLYAALQGHPAPL